MFLGMEECGGIVRAVNC